MVELRSDLTGTVTGWTFSGIAGRRRRTLAGVLLSLSQLSASLDDAFERNTIKSIDNETDFNNLYKIGIICNNASH